MKKKLIVILGFGLVLVIVAAVVLPLVFIDPLIKTAVEKAGPMVAKVETRLDGANVSLLSGKGTLKGLFVGNPAGFKSPFSVKAGEVTLAVNPGSLLADKVVVREIRLINPEVAFEGGPMNNNFSKILDNVTAFTGGASTNATTDPGPGKKLQVDELVVSGAKVTATTQLSSGRPVTLELPEIRLAGLGTGPEGITAGDLMAVLLKELSNRAMTAMGTELTKLGSAVVDQARQEATKSIEGATRDAQKKLEGILADPFKKRN